MELAFVVVAVVAVVWAAVVAGADSRPTIYDEPRRAI